jgi:type II secretory pathway pseudopilin PulG
MAALLVALAVMAIMMSVALPVWRHEAQRQKEDELIWRGNQYVRAIRLYSMKMGGTLPPSVDALVSGHFLRKNFKDPITNDDFELLGGAATQPGVASGRGQPGAGAQPAGQSPPSFSSPSQPAIPGTAATGGTVPGGMRGVRSKSTDESIKVYQGRTHYNEWTFIYVSLQPGIGGPGRGQPGGPQRGQPGQGNPFGVPGGTLPGRGGNPPGRGGTPNGPPGRGFGPGSAPQLPPGFPGRRGGGL